MARAPPRTVQPSAPPRLSAEEWRRRQLAREKILVWRKVAAGLQMPKQSMDPSMYLLTAKVDGISYETACALFGRWTSTKTSRNKAVWDVPADQPRRATSAIEMVHSTSMKALHGIKLFKASRAAPGEKALLLLPPGRATWTDNNSMESLTICLHFAGMRDARSARSRVGSGGGGVPFDDPARARAPDCMLPLFDCRTPRHAPQF